MSIKHTGGCLCGDTRYDIDADPLWVTICHCTFCQRATGADGMVEPIFDLDAFHFSGVPPKIYSQPSAGSGQDVHVHFCARCGTKLALGFDRWPDKIGLYIGTLNDPNAVKVTAENAKHIFVSEARAGTILPAGVKTYDRHAAENDGTPIDPIIHDAPFVVR